jgi:hypothetical protein
LLDKLDELHLAQFWDPWNIMFKQMSESSSVLWFNPKPDPVIKQRLQLWEPTDPVRGSPEGGSATCNT